MKMVRCKWCSEETDMTGTGECNRCWELRYRIEGNLRLAKLMIKTISENPIDKAVHGVESC